MFILALSLFLFGCSLKQKWTATYYPDKNNLYNHKTQSGFVSVDDCRNWIYYMAQGNTNFDYECGLNCRYDEKLQIYSCKTTQK